MTSTLLNPTVVNHFSSWFFGSFCLRSMLFSSSSARSFSWWSHLGFEYHLRSQISQIHISSLDLYAELRICILTPCSTFIWRPVRYFKRDIFKTEFQISPFMPVYIHYLLIVSGNSILFVRPKSSSFILLLFTSHIHYDWSSLVLASTSTQNLISCQ